MKSQFSAGMRIREKTEQKKQPSVLRGRGGFALIAVLVMLILVVTLTASMAQRSLTLALSAANREATVRARWATTSFQTAVLDNAERILDARATGELPGNLDYSSHVLELDVTLNETRYRLTLSDEDAKVNLNSVFHLSGETRISSIIRDLRTATTGVIPDVRLRPFEVSGDSPNAVVFDSWGQVFEQTQDSSPVDEIIQATHDVTCWGSGRLNIERASTQSLVILLQASGLPEQTTLKIAEQHSASNPEGLSELLDQIDLTVDKRNSVERSIQIGSSCHSLWAKSPTGVKLFIRERSQGNGAYLSTFTW